MTAKKPPRPLSPAREAVRQANKNCILAHLKYRDIVLQDGHRVPEELRIWHWTMRALLDTIDDLVAEGLVEIVTLSRERQTPFNQPQVRIRLKPQESAPTEVESGRPQ